MKLTKFLRLKILILLQTIICILFILVIQACNQPENLNSETDKTETSLPDLVVTSLQVDSWTSEQIFYTYTISNIGEEPVNLDGPTDELSDNVRVQAYLSSDTVYDSNDIFAGGRVISTPTKPLGELSSRESVTQSFSCTVTVDPLITPYLILKVDSVEIVEELDEDNNTLFTEIE